MNIILDLDETCIYSVDLTAKIDPDNKYFDYFFVNFPPPNSKYPQFKVYVRKYVIDFINSMCENGIFITFWSAGDLSYVLEIVKYLTRSLDHKYINMIKGVYFKEISIASQNATNSLKNLNWLEQYDPKMQGTFNILIDDLKENCDPNIGHAYNIKSFKILNDKDLIDSEFARLKIILLNFYSNYINYQ